MVHTCAVPGCTNRSDRQSNLSYHRLPLKNKVLLKQWIHKIGRANLPLHDSTRVCSEHFAEKRGLLSSSVPTYKLPGAGSQPHKIRKPPTLRSCNIAKKSQSYESSGTTKKTFCDMAVQTDLTSSDIQALELEVDSLHMKVKLSQRECEAAEEKQRFRTSSISDDNAKVRFYTGFSTFSALLVCFNFLGPAVDRLNYWASTSAKDKHGSKSTKGRKRILPPLEEFFVLLVRLRLGLFEQDLAYRFGVSQSTISRIINTWINFLYLQLKEIPLWPPKSITSSNMPQVFKEKYPSTRVIIDATEVYVEQPAVPELQQLTFSNYKHHNTYKGLIGISPSGAVIFVSTLYPGSISDKELTRRCGILEWLEEGDSVMADRGFDIQDDLALLGVKLNIPPFLKGKQQLTQQELVETRRIASLRIHVERAMEQIKNFHIFDRPLPPSFRDTANQVFFVCAVLTNFNPPLCM